MTRRQWSELRDKHLQTPEARERYQQAKVTLEAKLALYWNLLAIRGEHDQCEADPELRRVSDELWEALDEEPEPNFEELGRLIWAQALERGPWPQASA